MQTSLHISSGCELLKLSPPRMAMQTYLQLNKSNCTSLQHVQLWYNVFRFASPRMWDFRILRPCGRFCGCLSYIRFWLCLQLREKV